MDGATDLPRFGVRKGMDPKDLGTVNSDLMTGRYGGAGASAAWQTVLDLYYQDRLREAFDHALSLGVGMAHLGLTLTAWWRRSGAPGSTGRSVRFRKF
ncbi:hypothetical protein CCB80_09280 [Armatimonadetes bacterium Uphvl-Ar1]|nr:hypothetical protein CCB80_09280 [Armatimonadetes bacterium Uphvl-Ar1]